MIMALLPHQKMTTIADGYGCLAYFVGEKLPIAGDGFEPHFMIIIAIWRENSLLADFTNLKIVVHRLSRKDKLASLHTLPVILGVAIKNLLF